MEVIVTLVWLVYHDVACIRLELEIADAVKFYVSHHVWKHPLDCEVRDHRADHPQNAKIPMKRLSLGHEKPLQCGRKGCVKIQRQFS